MLGVGAAQVAAVAEAVPGAHELQRGDALEGVAALGQLEVGVRVVDVVVDAGLHAADGVGHVHHAGEADHHEVTQRDAGQLVDGLHLTERAVTEGAVDHPVVALGGVLRVLRVGAGRDVDHGVARDAHHRGVGAVGGYVDDHLDVGVAVAAAAAVAAEPAVLGRVPGVGAEHQDVDRSPAEGVRLLGAEVGVAAEGDRVDVPAQLVVEPGAHTRRDQHQHGQDDAADLGDAPRAAARPASTDGRPGTRRSESPRRPEGTLGTLGRTAPGHGAALRHGMAGAARAGYGVLPVHGHRHFPHSTAGGNLGDAEVPRFSCTVAQSSNQT